MQKQRINYKIDFSRRTVDTQVLLAVHRKLHAEFFF